MIFHENRLLADDSQCNIIPYFYQKLGKMSQNLSSAAVVIGALRVNTLSKTCVKRPLSKRQKIVFQDQLSLNIWLPEF